MQYRIVRAVAAGVFCVVCLGAMQPVLAGRNRGRDESAGPSTEEISLIQRYERLLARCDEKPSERCPSIMFDLAGLYYDSSRVAFVKAVEAYDEEMTRWEKRKRGPPPVRPEPDYSRARKVYQRLVTDYPDFPRNDAAYYMMGNICTLDGDVAGARDAFRAIIRTRPDSKLASLAHLREADFCYMEGDHTAGLRHLAKVERAEVANDMWEMVVYRRAEHYYNLAEFDLAIQQFFTYLEACDDGSFPKKQFRAEAIQNLAATFADMSEGSTRAEQFFSRHRGRAYEADVIFLIGTKNKDHGQFERAVEALSSALSRFPYHPDAPQAHMDMVHCLLVLKKHEEANRQRLRLVEQYSPEGEWHRKNSRNRPAVDEARMLVRQASRDACLYLHYWALKRKEAPLYEQARVAYERYVNDYPEDRWQVYEFTHNLAELYGAMGRTRDAVLCYWKVASTGLSDFPPRPAREREELSEDQGTEGEQRRAASTRNNKPSFTQADAGWNAIVLLDQLRTKVTEMEGLEPEKAYHLPVTQQLLTYAREYGTLFPQDSMTSSVVYLAARTHYEGKAYTEATRDLWFLIENWPAEKIVIDARRLLGDIYVQVGEFDDAESEYRVILARSDLNEALRTNVTRLAAGAVFSKAESLRKKGSESQAARLFVSIMDKYPDPDVGERAWFQAGVCYEQAERYEKAAGAFQDFVTRFPNSDMREKAFYRSAESYKKADKWVEAGEVYRAAAQSVRRADFAIPSLASAAEAFTQSGALEKAGRINVEIHARYPSDPRSGLALYNAGVLFEKAEEYPDALSAYRALLTAFPTHEYACDAAYAAGECLEKLQRWPEAGSAFVKVAERSTCGLKGVIALVRAGKAYRTGGQSDRAIEVYEAAADRAERTDGNEAEVAALGGEAHYFLGRAWQARSEQVTLTGRNESQVRERMGERQKHLERAARHYNAAIKTGVTDWVVRSNLAIADAMVSLAEGVCTQKLFATTQAEQIAMRVQVKMSLDQYYTGAIEKLLWNIRTARTQNITGALVDSSADAFVAAVMQHGDQFREASEMLLTAPVPRLPEEDLRLYRDMVQEKSLMIGDEAIKRYKAGLQAAQEVELGRKLTDRIETAIRDINPGYMGVVVEQLYDTVPSEGGMRIDTLIEGDSLLWRRDTSNN